MLYHVKLEKDILVVLDPEFELIKLAQFKFESLRAKVCNLAIMLHFYSNRHGKIKLFPTIATVNFH